MNERSQAEVTEAQFQRLVVDTAKMLGLRVYHTHDSRRSEPGFPDLVIVGSHGVLFRELKTQKGRVRPEQQYWLAILHAAGCNAAIWRPQDFPLRVMHELKELGKVTLQPSVSAPRIPKQGR